MSSFGIWAYPARNTSGTFFGGTGAGMIGASNAGDAVGPPIRPVVTGKYVYLQNQFDLLQMELHDKGIFDQSATVTWVQVGVTHEAAGVDKITLSVNGVDLAHKLSNVQQGEEPIEWRMSVNPATGLAWSMVSALTAQMRLTVTAAGLAGPVNIYEFYAVINAAPMGSFYFPFTPTTSGTAGGGTFSLTNAQDLVSGSGSYNPDGGTSIGLEVDAPFSTFADITVLSTSELTATIPAHAASSQEIAIYCASDASPGVFGNFLYGQGVLPVPLVYQATAPLGMDPDVGPRIGGTPVTVTGTGFGAGMTITLGGVPMFCTVDSPTELSCIIPQGLDASCHDLTIDGSTLTDAYCMSNVSIVAPVPVMQFFDNDGNVLAGGFVYTYYAGTDTLLSTYSDSALTTPNDNPLELDDSGRAVIYMQPLMYKFDVQDEDGNSMQGYPQDNVYGSVWPGVIQGFGTLSPGASANGLINDFSGTLNKASSGTHALFALMRLQAPTINTGASTLTDAATLAITAAPSVGSNLYALLVQAGLARFNGGIQTTLQVSPAATALSISSNTITPTQAVHTVGAGLIKTITVPSVMSGKSGQVAIIPTAAYTYDGTGNLSVPSGGGTAVVDRTMTFTWDGSSRWKPSY